MFLIEKKINYKSSIVQNNSYIGIQNASRYVLEDMICTGIMLKRIKNKISDEYT